MLTVLQRKTANAIVNIFETGSALGDYAKVTLLRGDTGGLTYGRAQTTLKSGNLYLLIKAYVEEEAGRADFRDAFRERFLQRLRDKDDALNDDTELHDLLERAAREDPVMPSVQDAFFERVYWEPASSKADAFGLRTALGYAVVYDSFIHGSFSRIARRVEGATGLGPRALGEEAWVTHYLQQRRHWLATHSNTLLHRTVYRMDALSLLVADQNWALDLPITVRGVLVDASILQGPPVIAPAEDDALPLLKPGSNGSDVRTLQRALNRAGYDIEIDGDFGSATEQAVRRFQARSGLIEDGLAGPATWAALLDGGAEGVPEFREHDRSRTSDEEAAYLPPLMGAVPSGPSAHAAGPSATGGWRPPVRPGNERNAYGAPGQPGGYDEPAGAGHPGWNGPQHTAGEPAPPRDSGDSSGWRKPLRPAPRGRGRQPGW